MFGGPGSLETASGVEGMFASRIDRRRVLRIMSGGAAAAIVGGLLKSMPALAAGAHYRTIASLNLRSKPSSSGKVLLVMPGNVLVKDLGDAKSGYTRVEYQGTAGWACGDYLTPTSERAAPPISGEAKTTSSVNCRQGPDTSDPIIQTLKKGTWVETSDTVVEGFRHWRPNGVRGWVFDEFLGNEATKIQPG